MNMDTAVTHTSRVPNWAGLALSAITGLRTIAHWWRMNRAISRLSGYPDVMLKDVGLSRGGIQWAVRYRRAEVAQRRREEE
jgi:uncharacterized protein YjiS (DUF1127 family)